jgi:sensor histidine kinase YesM
MAKPLLFRIKAFLLQRRLSVILIVFLALTIMYVYALHSYRFEMKSLWFEGLSFLVSHAFFALILSRIHRFYHSKSAISIVHLSTIVLFTSLYLLFVYSYASVFVSEKETLYHAFVSNSYLLKGVVSFLILFSVANQFWIDRHLLEEEKRNAYLLANEKKVIQAELLNLKQQFQPHFLFNSLNSISALIGSEPKEARRMILLLSDFLRLSVRKKDTEHDLIEHELSFLNLYLEIEKVRFGHRLQIELICDEALKKYTIPNQLLQPLVENAIKYGLYGNIGELVIGIQFEERENSLWITISNPFDPEAVQASKGAGFGIKSIEQKLKILYGRTDLVQKIIQDEEFTIHVQLPLQLPKNTINTQP